MDTYRLLDMFQAAIKKDCKKPDDNSALQIAELYREIAIRCFEEDKPLEKIEKKKSLRVKDILKLDAEQLEEQIKQLRQTATEGEDLLVLTLLHAQKLFKEFLAIRDNADYLEAGDEEKVETFKSKYSEFHKKYPVIFKYMVCRGVFSLEAFRQFLIKSKNVLIQGVDPSKKGKINQWCELRAFYVQQAWKLMHNGRHYSTSDFLHTYDEVFSCLMQDYKKFEAEQDKAKEEIAITEQAYKMRAIYSALEAQESNEVTSKASLEAYEFLENLQYKLMYEGVIKEVKKSVAHVAHSVAGPGRGIDLSSMTKAEDY